MNYLTKVHIFQKIVLMPASTRFPSSYQQRGAEKITYNSFDLPYVKELKIVFNSFN